MSDSERDLHAAPLRRERATSTAEEVALGHRAIYLESELERIRPVYEAACAWTDAATRTDEGRLGDAVKDAVDAARSPR